MNCILIYSLHTVRDKTKNSICNFRVWHAVVLHNIPNLPFKKEHLKENLLYSMSVISTERAADWEIVWSAIKYA